MMLKNALTILFMIFLVSCKSDPGQIEGILEEKIDYDKFDDFYKNFEYTNKILGIKIEFDREWSILTQYKDFESFQKKYVKYITTEKSEVLFIGSNDAKKIGVRCYCETGGLSNEDFLKLVKELNSKDVAGYGISVLKEEKTVLRNFEAIHYVILTKINKYNEFVFDAVVFKNNNINYRLDFWCSKANYDLYKDYIFNLYQQTDFELPVK